MKPAFRFPLWLVPVCWVIAVLLGSAVGVLLLKDLLRDDLPAVDACIELTVKSAIVTSPAMLSTLAAVFLMNHYPRDVWKYGVGLASLQLIFGASTVFFAFFPLSGTVGFQRYLSAVIVEDLGLLPPALAYFAAGCVVHGAALWILYRKQRPDREETIGS